MKNRFRISALLLALFLCLKLVPFGAFADEFDGLPDHAYKVTLSDGNGMEQEYCVYDPATVTADRESAANHEFFTENGSLFFKLSGCPFEAPSGYVFGGWSPDPSVTPVTNDTTFTAQWTEAPVLRADPETKAQFTVSVTADPAEGGTVTGGSYDEGTSATVKAEAASGYHFVNWTEGDTVASTEASYTFELTGARALVANFEEDTTPETKAQYTISLSANPTEGGTVEGGGSYDDGASATVTATAADNYTFVNWTENSVEVSTAASYEFTVTGARALVANFEENTTPETKAQYTISVSANPTAGGTVSGGDTYDEGASATVTAEPTANYHFVNWTEGETVASTDASYTFEVTGARTLVANFEADTIPPTQHTVSVSANPAAGGTVSGGGTYDDGASATVTAAAAAENYQFVNWTEGETVASTNASYTFTVTADRTLTANFVETFAITMNTMTHGTVTADAARAPEGAAVTLTITPETGYELDAIDVKDPAGNTVAVSNNTFVMPGCNVTVSATFKAAVPVSYKITTGANGAWIKGSGLTYTITAKRSVSDSETVSHFNGVMIDKNILPLTDYTIKAGSVIVTVKASAMQRLALGYHTFTLVFDDGTAATRVYIWGNPGYPSTGDERETASWAVLAGVTLVGMGAIALLGCMYWKKQKNKGKE